MPHETPNRIRDESKIINEVQSRHAQHLICVNSEDRPQFDAAVQASAF